VGTAALNYVELNMHLFCHFASPWPDIPKSWCVIIIIVATIIPYNFLWTGPYCTHFHLFNNCSKHNNSLHLSVLVRDWNDFHKYLLEKLSSSKLLDFSLKILNGLEAIFNRPLGGLEYYLLHLKLQGVFCFIANKYFINTWFFDTKSMWLYSY
jgi:hypothetical protein